MKKRIIAGILETVTGIAGFLLLGLYYSWMIASIVFLLLWSQNLHNRYNK